MMQSDPEFQAFKDRVILAKPLLAESQRRIERGQIDGEQRPKRTTLVKVDDDIGKGFDASPLWTENKNGLSLIHETPCCCQAQLSLIPRKNPFALPLGRNEQVRHRPCQKARNERPFVADAQVEKCRLPAPHDFAIPKPRRPPVVLNQAPRLVAAQPVGKVVELITVGKYGRKAYDASLSCIRPLQQSLDLDLVAHLALLRSDHMAFIKHKQTHVIEQTGVVAQCEVDLFRCRHYDISRANCILVKTGDADAPVKSRDRFA